MFQVDRLMAYIRSVCGRESVGSRPSLLVISARHGHTHLIVSFLHDTHRPLLWWREKKKRDTHTKKKGGVGVAFPYGIRNALGADSRGFFFFFLVQFDTYFLHSLLKHTFLAGPYFKWISSNCFPGRKEVGQFGKAFLSVRTTFFFFFTSIVIKRHDSFPGKHQINKFGRLGAPHERWRAHTHKKRVAKRVTRRKDLSKGSLLKETVGKDTNKTDWALCGCSEEKKNFLLSRRTNQ